MIRAISIAAAIYLFAMLVALSVFAGYDAPNGLILALILSSPIGVAIMVAFCLKRFQSLGVIAAFCGCFSIFSACSFYLTVTGSHDAQWQLEFLRIPLFGLPAVILTSAITFIGDRWAGSQRR